MISCKTLAPIAPPASQPVGRDAVPSARDRELRDLSGRLAGELPRQAETRQVVGHMPVELAEALDRLELATLEALISVERTLHGIIQ